MEIIHKKGVRKNEVDNAVVYPGTLKTGNMIAYPKVNGKSVSNQKQK